MWRYLVASRVRPAHAAVVRDRSESVISGCDCTAALVKRALDSPGIGAGSTVTVTVTGDESTAGEPRLLASLKVPVNRRVLEGRSAALKEREELLESVKTLCEELPQTKTSPIFRAIGRAIEHLRSLGCGPGLECALYVQTDLEETGDGQIRRALTQPTQNKLSLPSPINNDAIDVVISGVAETAGLVTGNDGKTRQMTKPRDPERVDRIRSVWSALFTNPERVRFEPYAPKH
jgi:hypothetical protein